MAYTKEQRLINSISGSTKKQRSAPKKDDSFVMANNSGDHQRSIKRNDPINDYDLSNKGYVDNNTFWERSGTTLTPKNSGDAVNVDSIESDDYADSTGVTWATPDIGGNVNLTGALIMPNDGIYNGTPELVLDVENRTLNASNGNTQIDFSTDGKTIATTDVRFNTGEKIIFATDERFNITWNNSTGWLDFNRTLGAGGYNFDQRMNCESYITATTYVQASGTAARLQFNDTNSNIEGDFGADAGGAYLRNKTEASPISMRARRTGDAATGRLLIKADPDDDIEIGDVTGGDVIGVDVLTGQVTLKSNARIKKEFSIPLSDFNPGASGPTPATQGIFPSYEFTIGDDMHISFEVPTDCDTSEDLSIEVYWGIDEAYATNSGEVRWSADWRAIAVGESVTGGSSGTIDFGDVNIPASANTIVKTTGTIAAASVAQGDLIALNGSRVALTGGSNPSAEPYIIMVNLEYTANKLGEAV